MTQPTPDYYPMWEALGLDLGGHDGLLAAIPNWKVYDLSRRPGPSW